MLIDLQYKYNGYANGYTYSLTDSEFGIVDGNQIHGGSLAVAIALAQMVITEYSKRDLNVPVNLFRLMAIMHKRYGIHWSIENQLAILMTHPNMMLPYKEELVKYGALL